MTKTNLGLIVMWTRVMSKTVDYVDYEPQVSDI